MKIEIIGFGEAEMLIIDETLNKYHVNHGIRK